MATPPFEQNDTGGDGYVQRCDCARHWDAHQHIAVLLHKLVQTLPLAAEYKRRWRCVLDICMELGATLVQTVNPVPLLL